MKENRCWKISCSAPFLYSSPLFLLASAPHLSSFFLFQPFFYFSTPFVSVQRLFLPFFPAPHFFFSLDVLPFFQPKILFQPKTFFSLAQTSCYFKFSTSFLFFFSGQHLLLFFFFFSYVFKGQPKTCCSPKLVAAQKAHSISPIRACLFVKMKSNRLPQNQEGPAFHAKKKKNLPSASIHPKPNILSSCFVSFIWINLHFL